MVAPQHVVEHVRVVDPGDPSLSVLHALAADEVVQAEALVGSAVPSSPAPVTVVPLVRGVQVPERVDVPGSELPGERVPLLLGEAGLLGEVGGAEVVAVEGLVSDVEVAAPDDRFGGNLLRKRRKMVR